ncbi:MAG TPA: NADPH-dependent oxidoreductase [Thermoflexales bacterium]|nr:NADPH-dependent oxidoreductase [Thermoflexales bacterium]HQW35076.1 NADPH-dependent oxidoreductase [Thermoflexales bacterium]HQZ21622.1 NADPH-dependent oxidoreductase [Thermoflexales bacterium]
MSVTNSIIEHIHAHASARHYKPDPVPQEWLEAIVAAGQRASSSSNLQAYSVIAVTNPQTRAALAHLCGDQEHIAEAPLFLAFCADLSRLNRAAELRHHSLVSEPTEHFLIAAVDAALMAQNTALAAESLGLGVCYIGSLRNHPPEVAKLLNLPRLMFPLVGMTLGFPTRAGRVRPRLPLKGVLHHEVYSDQNQDAALAEYDEAMIATGIYDNRQVAVPGHPDKMEQYGWTEHSARRMSQPSRAALRKQIQDMGWGLE